MYFMFIAYKNSTKQISVRYWPKANQQTNKPNIFTGSNQSMKTHLPSKE